MANELSARDGDAAAPDPSGDPREGGSSDTKMGGVRAVREQTRGRCELCGKAFGKAGMARHIPVCRRRKPPETGPDALLLQVEGRGLPDYWLFLGKRSGVEDEEGAPNRGPTAAGGLDIGLPVRYGVVHVR